MSRRGRVHFAVAAGVLLAAAGARADSGPTYNAAGTALYDLQLFRPAIDTKGYITTNASQVLGLWDFSIGLVGTIAGQPLKLESADGQRHLTENFLVTPFHPIDTDRQWGPR